VFRLLPMVSGRDMSTDVIASLADLPPAEARRILLGLARTHLVEGARGWLGQWRMHDLLRVYALRLSGAHAVADGRDQAADRMLKYERSKRRAVCGGPMTVHGIANELGVADKYVMSKLQKWASLSGRHLQRSRLLRHGGCWRLSEVARAKRRASGQHLRTETTITAAGKRPGRTCGFLGAGVLHFDEATAARQKAAASSRRRATSTLKASALSNLGDGAPAQDAPGEPSIKNAT